MKVPSTFPRLYFNAMEFNTLSGDVSIGECYISLKRVFKKLLQEGRLSIEKKWVPFSHPKDPGELRGECLISLDMIPKFEADQDPVGEGQEEPNKNPYLERPKVGRGIGDFLAGLSLDFKFNFDLFGTLKVLIALVSILVIVVILFVKPGLLV